MFVLAFCLSIQLVVFAETDTPRIIDNSDLISDEMEEQLTAQIEEIAETYQFDIVLLTEGDLQDKTPREYCDDFYEENGFGYGDTNDGVLFLVSLTERDWYIITEGYGDWAVNNYCVDLLEDLIVPYLSDGDYDKAYEKFVNVVESCVKESTINKPYTESNPYRTAFDYFKIIGIVAIISIVVGLIFLSVLSSNMKSVKLEPTANRYILLNSFKIYSHSDTFLYSNVTKTAIPKSSGSGGGGGGGGGGSSGGGGGKF